MNTPEVYDIAIGIERRLSNMYHRFSTLFKENPEVHNFWTSVAGHEKSHSEALTFSKGYLMWNRPVKQKKTPLLEGSAISELESLEEVLREYERKVKKERVSLQEALDILLKIENGGLNHLYNQLVHLSGFRPPQKAEGTYCPVYEHMKVIKSFVDKYYRGPLPPICIEDYADTGPLKPQPTTPAAGMMRGKIIEIISGMSYGFIEGADRQTYLFLPEDILQGEWGPAVINQAVEFSVMGLPWGPRAMNISFKS